MGDRANDGSIDLTRLERELTSALAADKKYSRENDAKFRAVNQRVATYEEFREIVNASHLTPLERKDLLDSARKQPWNMVAHLGGYDKKNGTTAVSVTPGEGSFKRPANEQDFMRIWRTLNQESRYRYLVDIGGSGLHELFKVEIGMGLLGEILQTLNGGFVEENDSQVLCILSRMSECPRFSLSITFLSTKEQEAIKELFRKLSLSQTLGQTACNISELARLYSVSIPVHVVT